MIDFLIDYRDFESVAALSYGSLDDFAFNLATETVIENLPELEWCGKTALCAIEKASK